MPEPRMIRAGQLDSRLAPMISGAILASSQFLQDAGMRLLIGRSSWIEVAALSRPPRRRNAHLTPDPGRYAPGRVSDLRWGTSAEYPG